jgi:hypothetical protein
MRAGVMRQRLLGSIVMGLPIALLAVAGCSSSRHNAARSTTPTQTVPPTARNSKIADQSIANRVVLVAGDLAGSWTPGPVQPNDKSGDAQMARCLGVRNSDSGETAYTGSHQFGRGKTRIFSETRLYPSDAIVTSDLHTAHLPREPSCEARAATDLGATHVHITQTALPKTAHGLPGIQETGSFEAPPGSPQPGRYSVDIVSLFHGRIETSISESTYLSPVPPGVMDRATAAIAQRLITTKS